MYTYLHDSSIVKFYFKNYHFAYNHGNKIIVHEIKFGNDS